jgi:hypothetical protein
MEFSPIYPAVPSREYLELPPSFHPILFDGYEIHPSLIAAQSFSSRKDESPYARETPRPKQPELNMYLNTRKQSLVKIHYTSGATVIHSLI